MADVGDSDAVRSAVKIRRATSSDVPLVLEFIRELAAYERLSAEVAADEDGLRASLFGERPGAEVLLAYTGGIPAAFAVFFQNFSTFLGQPGIYLEDLFVRPEFRRRGIARAILRHLAGEAVSRGCGRFEWAVLDWNRPAIDFYQKMGATVLADWRICRLTGDALARLARENP